jgi:three-Cys-motif partner protein
LTRDGCSSRLAFLYSKGQDLAQPDRAAAQDRGDQLSLGFDDTWGGYADSVRKRGARRKPHASERDLSTRPHTRLKLDSLAAYLPQWFGIASHVANDTHYIDAFAGAGHYPDGAGTSKGSPVIACEAALGALSAKPQWRPHLRFIERSRDTAEELRDELARFEGALDYRVIQGDAAKELPGLVVETVGSPTLLFIDPDGYAPVTFDLLRSLAGRHTMTEVLLSVDAQGIRRAHARGETVALTAFSGGDWWSDSLGPDGLIDLRTYFRDLTSRLGGVGALFPFANVQHLKFLSDHAHRAIIQCCMSAEGPKRWIGAMERSRAGSQVVDAFFPEIDEVNLVSAIVERLRALGGRSGIYFGGCINSLSDVPWNESGLHQALLFLQEHKLVEWSSRLGRGASPAPRFRFARDWPQALVCDGHHRTEPAKPQVAAGTAGR